jgi:hypothetical protein
VLDVIFRKPPGPACVQFILSKWLEGSWETGASTNDEVWAQDDEGVIERIKKLRELLKLPFDCSLDAIKFRVIILIFIIVFGRQ